MYGDGLKIIDGSRIAIVGGGPGGCSCAIKLLLEAKKKGINIKVYIFECKDYKKRFNQCVGVLSPPIVDIFEKVIGIDFPSDIVKREIKGYELITSKGSRLSFSETYGTYATRRVLLDRFMLEMAKKYGAEIINSRVTGIEFHNGDEVRIYSEGGFLKSDVAVCASGLDEGFAECLEKASERLFSYRRPGRSLDTIITKIHVNTDFIENNLTGKIFAFLLNDISRIEFGAITPKGDHIIINIAGRNITSMDMDSFLKHPAVKKIIGNIESQQLDYYKGRYPIKPAKGIIGDRFVTVGDATGWIRPYKGKGINVALETGAIAGILYMENYSGQYFYFP